jgi:flagellar motor switch protein FliN
MPAAEKIAPTANDKTAPVSDKTASTVADKNTAVVDKVPRTGPDKPAAAFESEDGRAGALDLLKDVEVEITVEIGRRRLRIADILRLSAGQMLELSKAAGEPLDVYVNGRLLGRGEAVVMGDRYGVRITEIVAPAAPARGGS